MAAVSEGGNIKSQWRQVGPLRPGRRNAVTVALRKPGKDDFSTPQLYRPIALLETLGKALESIVAQRLSDLAENMGWLPRC